MNVRVFSAAASLGLTALLAGCGVTTPAPTPTSASAASAPPIAAQEPPLPALDLPCAEAVPAEVLTALLTDLPRSVRDLEVDPIANLTQIEDRQVGIQRCGWDNDAFAAGFAVMPDAASAFDEKNGWYDVDEQYVRRDELGDRSAHQCSYGYCYADVLVGDHWLIVHAYRRDLMDELDLEPLFLPFADSAVRAVRDAAEGGTRERWSIPESAFRPEPGWCSDGFLSSLGQVLGIPGLFPPGSDGWSGFTFETWDRSRFMRCPLSGDVGERVGYGHIVVIPGGTWALSELGEEAHERYGPYEIASADVKGGSALLASNDNGSAALVSIDGSILWFAYDGFGRDEFVALLPDVVEVVRAHPAP